MKLREWFLTESATAVQVYSFWICLLLFFALFPALGRDDGKLHPLLCKVLAYSSGFFFLISAIVCICRTPARGIENERCDAEYKAKCEEQTLKRATFEAARLKKITDCKDPQLKAMLIRQYEEENWNREYWLRHVPDGDPNMFTMH